MNIVWLSVLLYPLLTQAESSCAAEEDGVCINDAMALQPSCTLASARGDLYSNGGTAQAYKPNQPEKKEICDPSMYESWRHRMATWPFSKSSGRPPKITLSIRPWSCNATAGECCQLMSSDNKLVVQIWQTRPDGTYSSLRPGQQDGDCRAQLSGTSLTFTTIAPGSTGNLGGLGPYGIDFAPYGPPVIHILALHPEMEPLLMNVPIVIQRNTLESATFKGSDWRGAAWTQSKVEVLPYNISSWEANAAEKSIAIRLDVFLHARKKSERAMPVSKEFCRSWVYGLPSSFFVEPISICAPSMMDFFAL